MGAAARRYQGSFPNLAKWGAICKYAEKTVRGHIIVNGGGESAIARAETSSVLDDGFV